MKSDVPIESFQLKRNIGLYPINKPNITFNEKKLF